MGLSFRKQVMKMEFIRAGVEQIEAVYDIIDQCRNELTARGILQWDAHYPNRVFFEKAVTDSTLFVLREDEAVTGIVVLDECQASEWNTVRWQKGTGAILVVHSLAVLPAAQGRGYGTALLGFCETFARKAGYARLRLDAYSGNAAALRFYERHGYTLQGEIELTFKPAGHRRYCCYEKLLTEAKYDKTLP